jgi:hypothetical protein
MSDQEARAGSEELQFDRVITEAPSSAPPSRLAVICAACQTSIETEYYAVIAIAHLEIGIVAILIGYMVGYAVRKGARGRGGLRFQVLAVALTYASVALAYTPITVKQAINASRNGQKAQTTSGNSQAAEATDSRRAATPKPSGGRLLIALALLLAFIAALPVLVVLGSFPSGLISAFIIFIGMRQAWKMTGAPRLQILGPYRVGAAAPFTPA